VDKGFDESSGIQWLYQFHQYLWGKLELEPKIFCTADLTLAHYTKLQNKLDTNFPTHHEDSFFMSPAAEHQDH
jgi:hypothetical protein